MITQEDLKEVLGSILTNPSFIGDAVIDKAIKDTEQIVAQRELETPFVLDIAVYRVFTRINLEVPKSVTEAYKEALRRLKEVPIKTDEGSFSVKVGQRSAIWI